MNDMEEGEYSRLHAIHPSVKPPPIVAPRSEAKQQRSNSGKEHKPNYWEPIMMRHAKDLNLLPVPPKDFVRREKKAIRSEDSERRDHLKVSLRALLRREKKRELRSHTENQCRRWMLQPMTEKPPEPMPGVPTITVTDAGGKTWWPKDLNSYITSEQSDAISKSATEQHYDPNSEAHCAAFQEAYRKGLHNKPVGMRPEVLYCAACWTEQEKFEEEEARVANEVRSEGDRLLIKRRKVITRRLRKKWS